MFDPVDNKTILKASFLLLLLLIRSLYFLKKHIKNHSNVDYFY